jgi:GNAT superfamily N-acetyltransferase
VSHAASEPSSAVVYHEPARSYWTLLYVVAIFAVGFVIDLVLGGGIAHLLGWLAATAVVVGIWALVLYAVRSEKSLRVTAHELQIGDEAIPRDRVVGFAAAVDDEELPVLGWPGGKPRQLRGVTLRLIDGQDLVVPTRFPERLRAVLGIDAGSLSPSLSPTGPDVRAAARSDLGQLADIDQRAETLFRLAGYDLPDVPFDEEDLAKAAAVFVAGRPPIGFVWLTEVDGVAHVEELAVIPKWMRQGIGSRLLERAGEWATRKEYPAITLITFADVPWNGPFYRARGFVELADLTPGLAALRAREKELGFDDVGRRVVMRRDL